MRLVLLVALAIAAPLLLSTTAAAWPPVCIDEEVGEEGGKVYAYAYANCGVGARVVTCPKDGFCTDVEI